MSDGLRAFLGFFFSALKSFFGDHLAAIRRLFTLDLIENLIVLAKRLFVVWPCTLSLVLGALLLTLSQVADLLARPLDAIELVVLILCLFAFWIVPLHLGARILLNAEQVEEERDLSSKLDIWLPRDLALLAIVALALAIRAQTRDFGVLGPHFEANGLSAPGGILWLVPAVLFVMLLIYLATRERTKDRLSAEAGRRLSVNFAGATVILIFIASMAPFEVADLFGGLLFVPMLVGGWIMPLVGLIVLAKSGLVWRRVVQLGTVLTLAAMLVANGLTSNPFHDLRLMPDDAPKQAQPAQLDLETYIAQWKTLNGCAAEELAGRRCKAIFVTAEGGASRAAFQVATVMGELLDKPPMADFRNRLFLLSGVSGGSLGLGTVRQALADSTDGRPPCRQDPGRAARHWIFYKTDRADDATKSWRKCLQLLVSADYLTPAVVGLVLRDWWMAVPAMLDLGFDDRSALLERAMERHYAAITGKDCGTFEGLCSPFGHVDRSGGWLPALMLNSTLVERGQNVVASDIDPSSSFPNESICRSKANRVYPAHLVYTDTIPTSYDMFELLDARTSVERTAANPVKVIRDLRMSTAIVASARFPLISSRGNVRDPERRLVGQLVDGGYFDNSGLSSILDIVDALDCHKVDSVVINIRNNPLDENADRLWSFPGRENIRQPPLERSAEQLNVAIAPVQAFLNSSEGHVLANRFATMNRVGYGNYIFNNIYKAICVGRAAADGACLEGRVQLTSVSMSWWLSSNVQLFIEMQDQDKLLGLECGKAHCRYKPIDMLAAALRKDAVPDSEMAEPVDPGVMGLESTIDVRRYAQ